MQRETKYHKNGGILETVPIENGKINGVVQRYSEKGFLASETPYVDGLVQGIKKRFYADGTVKAEIPYAKGLIHGLKKRYNKYGILFETIQYHHGEYAKTVFYDSCFAAGLSEEEKLLKIRQDKILEVAHLIFDENLYEDISPTEIYNPHKVITNDKDDSFENCKIIERPKKELKIDPQVYAFTHPKGDCSLLNERIDRGVIVGNSHFTSETVTSFEITYFKGSNPNINTGATKRVVKEYPITVWIEKGDGVEFKTRVWIKNGKWFGCFITSKNVSWEHYIWILFQKFNVLEWNSEHSVDANSEEFGSISVYSETAEKKYSWKVRKPDDWDDFLTFFNRFFGKNTRTSFEKGMYLTKEQECFFENGGTIKDFCLMNQNLQNLQNPNDIFYPKETNPCKCPCCGENTTYQDYRNLSKRFCYKCYAKVCTDFVLPKDVQLEDFISSIELKLASDMIRKESSVIEKLAIKNNDVVEVQYECFSEGEQKVFNAIQLEKTEWASLLDALFDKAHCHEWAVNYSEHDTDGLLDGEKWGVLKIEFKHHRLRHKKIMSLWSGKEPPYWDIAAEAFSKIVEKVKETHSQKVKGDGPVKSVAIILPKQCGPNEFVDERDGNVYKMVKIGNQIWMAENLRYAPPERDGEFLPRSILISDEIERRQDELVFCKNELLELEHLGASSPFAFHKSDEIEMDVKANKSSIKKMENFLNAIGDGKNLGRLYTWISANDLSWDCLGDQDHVSDDLYKAMTSTCWQGIAPQGWRIPSREDFQRLYDYCNSHSENKTAVSMKSKSGWVVAHKKLGCGGTDEFGFCALPSGFCNSEGNRPGDLYLGLCAMYWTCTPEDIPEEPYLAAGAYNWEIEHRLPNLYPMRDVYKEEHFHEDAVGVSSYMAIRCIKNE